MVGWITVMVGLALAEGPQQPLPPAPERPRPPVPTVPDNVPAFGTDVSAGYALGTLMGAWPEPGLSGSLIGRYDAFARDWSQKGPRLGASIWGSLTAQPFQTAVEDEAMPTVRFSHYGVMAILRHDPRAVVTGCAGFGFGRMDIQEYWQGTQVLPTLTFEAGARRKTGDRGLIDGLVRAHWATSRSPTDPLVQHEWWMVQGLLMLGTHVR